MSRHPWQISITVVFICLGILLSVQFQAQQSISGDLAMQRTENLIAMVRDLSEKRQKLALEIFDLNIRLNSQMESTRDEELLINSIKSELEELNIVTGSTPVKGSGLTVTIDHYMPILYIDIINIINELWAAGAEAISINNYRITAYTPIYYAEDDHSMLITVNNMKVDYPLIIKAIGNSNNLEKGMTIPGGIMDNLALFRAFPQLDKVSELVIPALENKPTYIFLSEYKEPDTPPAVQTAPELKN